MLLLLRLRTLHTRRLGALLGLRIRALPWLLDARRSRACRGLALGPLRLACDIALLLFALTRFEHTRLIPLQALLIATLHSVLLG